MSAHSLFGMQKSFREQSHGTLAFQISLLNIHFNLGLAANSPFVPFESIKFSFVRTQRHKMKPVLQEKEDLYRLCRKEAATVLLAARFAVAVQNTKMEQSAPYSSAYIYIISFLKQQTIIMIFLIEWTHWQRDSASQK